MNSSVVTTLVGKMDGNRMIALKEKDYMTMSSGALPGDIIEILGRYYRVMDGTLLDITQAFSLLLEGGDKHES